MKFVIQRVRKSAVFVQEKNVGAIKKGLLVLIGIHRGDGEVELNWMINKLLHLRIFEDAQGKMNKSVSEVKGDLLLVPNFTLCADTTHGNRPGFSDAEAPGKAKKIYNKLVSQVKEVSDLQIETGQFRAGMDVELVNDGPVTIILER